MNLLLEANLFFFLFYIKKKLLAEICEEAGAPGHEQKIREIVLREVKPLVDEVRIDNMGNVLAIKKGKTQKKVTSHYDYLKK